MFARFYRHFAIIGSFLGRSGFGCTVEQRYASAQNMQMFAKIHQNDANSEGTKLSFLAYKTLFLH